MRETKINVFTEAPPILYKYRSWDNECQKRLLTHCDIYFPSPSLFNDPFDSIIPLIPSGSPSDFRDYIREDVDIQYPEKSRKERKSIAAEWYRKRLYRDAKLQYELHQQRVNNQYGVCSLSEDYHNILLWAHYASSHQGYCVGLDWNGIISQNYEIERQRLSEQVFLIIDQVKYVAGWPSLQYPIVPPSRDTRNLIEVSKSLVQPFFHKSQDWSYEKEWRILSLSLNNFSIIINPLFVKSIYLGVKISEASKEEIISLKNKNFPHADLFQAIMRMGSFGIDFIQLD